MTPSEFLIEFEHVSKRYVKRPRTLRESLACAVFRHGESGQSGEEDFGALKDLSFAVKRGETLGIIGNNGAGKSTILKLIAGITTPSEGKVAVKGRISSLIELGAGFNQDLTGRENIYLNGGVLGMKTKEIDACIEQIVAFSELTHFMNVPVKYYSSGMYARLGFAIAANVKADIILTDEILAVGDVAFQRQCLQKFKELQASTTIVLVSHDLAKVREACSRVLWIKQGRLHCEGGGEKVVEAYLEDIQRDREERLYAAGSFGPEPDERRSGTGQVEIIEVLTCDEQGRPRTIFKHDDELLIQITYRMHKPSQGLGFGVKIISRDGVFVHGTNTFLQGMTITLDKGVGTINLRYQKVPLAVGTYWLTVGAASNNEWSVPYDLRERTKRFEVLSTRQDGGLVCLEHQWSNNDPL